MTLESPDHYSYPYSLSWYYRGPGYNGGCSPLYFTNDLDRDGRNEIVGTIPLVGEGVWENVGNDSSALVWHERYCGGNLAFDDFDSDGCSDFAASGTEADLWEDTGSCQFVNVWRDTLLQAFWPGCLVNGRH